MGFIHDVECCCKLLGEIKRDVWKKIPYTVGEFPVIWNWNLVAHILHNCEESVEEPLQLPAMKKMSCISLYSTGAQPCKVTEEKSIVMWCETCGGESIDWKMHWSHTHTELDILIDRSKWHQCKPFFFVHLGFCWYKHSLKMVLCSGHGFEFYLSMESIV